jgi:hypothetical protein
MRHRTSIEGGTPQAQSGQHKQSRACNVFTIRCLFRQPGVGQRADDSVDARVVLSQATRQFPASHRAFHRCNLEQTFNSIAKALVNLGGRLNTP